MDLSQTFEAMETPRPERASYTLWQLARYLLRLGTLGFGGAVALVTLALLWRWKKIPEPLIVLGAAIIGLVVYSVLYR